jgi:hypothetical protein
MRVLPLIILAALLPTITAYGATVRAVFYSDQIDRYINPSVEVRNTSQDATALMEAACYPPPLGTYHYSYIPDGVWTHLPSSHTDFYEFTVTVADPLTILDFHVRTSVPCENGDFKRDRVYRFDIVTATMELYVDDVLVFVGQAPIQNNPDPDPWDPTVTEHDFPTFMPLIGTYPPNARPPKVLIEPSVFESGDVLKVLNKQQPPEFPYFSQWQTRIEQGAQAGAIDFKVSLFGPDGTPAPNSLVYLELRDPPDPAPYRSDRGPGDNTDPTTDGRISAPPEYLVSASGSRAIVRTDANGIASARLHTSLTTAGDNYQIHASANRYLEEGQSCSPSYADAPCVRSGVFTVWKRVNTEFDQMYREGTFLAATAAAGATTVQLLQKREFDPPDGAQLLFIHAQRGENDSPRSEFVSVKSYRRGTLILNSALSNSYFGPITSAEPLTADAVVVYSAQAYWLDPGPFETAYEEAFIDVAIRGDSSPFPSVESRQMTSNAANTLAALWSTGEPDLHLIAAKYDVDDTFGLQPEYANFAYVFVQQCEDFGGADATDLASEVAAHESTHMWRLNKASDPGDHCLLTAYTNANERCQMEKNYRYEAANNYWVNRPEFLDGVVTFHYIPGVNGSSGNSEYLSLRAAGGVQ